MSTKTQRKRRNRRIRRDAALLERAMAAPLPRKRRGRNKNKNRVRTTNNGFAFDSVRGAIKTYGPAVADLIGGPIGKGIKSAIRGFGDYSVSNNSIMGLFGGSDPPEIVNSNQRGTIVRHREYLGDVSSTINFTTHEYLINPGVDDSFPWLSVIARGFEEFKFRGILYEFKSMSSDAVLSSAASSGLGTVIMATQYDVKDPIFLNKQQIENYEFANSRKPSLSFIHPVECARNQTVMNELFIRTGDYPEGTDPRFYDLGRFVLATQGMQVDGGVIGELWVTYEIELLKPKIPEDVAGQMAHYMLNTVTNSNPLGFAAPDETYDSLGLTLTSTTFTLPVSQAGTRWYFFHTVGGSSTAVASPTITFSGGTVVPITMFANGGTSIVNNSGSTTVRYLHSQAFAQTTQGAITVNWSVAGTYPSSATSGDLIVFKLQAGMTSAQTKIRGSHVYTLDEVQQLLDKVADQRRGVFTLI